MSSVLVVHSSDDLQLQTSDAPAYIQYVKNKDALKNESLGQTTPHRKPINHYYLFNLYCIFFCSLVAYVCQNAM